MTGSPALYIDIEKVNQALVRMNVHFFLYFAKFQNKKLSTPNR